MAMNVDEINASKFWSRVDIGTTDTCWPWTRGRFPDGYGAFWLNGQNIGAHRVAYSLSTGIRPAPGLQVCHRCDNPTCCNPDHLFIGTAKDNFLDSLRKGRRAKVVVPTARDHADKMPRGSSHWAVKRYQTLTDDIVKLIKQGLLNGERQCELMRRLNIPRRVVQRVASGRVWRHIQP